MTIFSFENYRRHHITFINLVAYSITYRLLPQHGPGRINTPTNSPRICCLLEPDLPAHAFAARSRRRGARWDGLVNPLQLPNDGLALPHDEQHCSGNSFKKIRVLYLVRADGQ
jgi:hypothetical protein